MVMMVKLVAKDGKDGEMVKMVQDDEMEARWCGMISKC
jgi:hypothetical protein